MRLVPVRVADRLGAGVIEVLRLDRAPAADDKSGGKKGDAPAEKPHA